VVLVVRLISFEHTIEPREELLCAVIRVDDDWYAISWRDGSDVVSCCNGTRNGALLLVVLQAFTTEEGGSSLGDLEDDGSFGFAGEETQWESFQFEAF
jgi:hypothetical protein